jgi:hypothetical protein
MQAIRGVLLKSMGRHEHAAQQIVAGAQNPFVCIARGWSAVVSVPLLLLNGFGLLDSAQSAKARSSVLFRLVSAVTFLAAIASPLLAYLADRTQIEQSFRDLWSSPTEQAASAAPNK